MEGKAIFTLLGVVCVYSAAGRGPRTSEPIADGQTRTATPEVVLQLKYEAGALDSVSLSQFRQAAAPPAGSVPAATRLCADLCHAGLGGESCGPSCTDMMPVGLASALRSENQSSAHYGEPRVGVCPALCANGLGSPLCNCPAEQEQASERLAADWGAVCDSFCLSDGYVLAGCPACKEILIPSIPVALANNRLLDTVEGWASWCSVQCRQGHGGAACNCDRAPFQ